MKSKNFSDPEIMGISMLLIKASYGAKEILR